MSEKSVRRARQTYVSMNLVKKQSSFGLPRRKWSLKPRITTQNPSYAHSEKSPISKTAILDLRSFVRISKNVKTRTHEHLKEVVAMYKESMSFLCVVLHNLSYWSPVPF